jgi:hypothetical protein
MGEDFRTPNRKIKREEFTLVAWAHMEILKLILHK